MRPSLMTWTILAPWIVASSVLVGACTRKESVPLAPKYYEDVAPILQERCVSCHVAGGIAPFPLTSYEAAAAVASSIKATTAARTMPPWGVDNSGSCHTYADARWLSDEEIDTLRGWADGGAPEGNPEAAPTPTSTTPGLQRVDATVDMGSSYTPNATYSDDYRCFVVDSVTTTDAYLTAFEVRPGEPKVVHHIILYGLTAEGETAAVQNDVNDPGLGYECFGGPGSAGAYWLGAWAPGIRVVEYPANTGILVSGNRKMVMQIHYNLANGALPDRTRIDLMGEATVAKPSSLAVISDFNLALSPGQSNATHTFSYPLDFMTGPAVVYAVFPHMHLLGKSSLLEIIRSDDTIECVQDGYRWDFAWQQLYFYESPIIAQPSDVLRMTCHYDTTSRTEVTTFGEGSEDEMCASIIYSSAP